MMKSAIRQLKALNLTENSVRLQGTVYRAPQVRETPAGIPLARFVMDHHSSQIEAELNRDIRFRIVVIATGKALADSVKRLKVGDQALVEGFLNRAVFKSGEYRIVIHAAALKIG